MYYRDPGQRIPGKAPKSPELKGTHPYQHRSKSVLEAFREKKFSMHFGEPAYWEARYQEELRKTMTNGLENFDWYHLFEPMYSVIESTIETKKPHKVLIVGIGRSNVIDVLYNKGFRDITAIDISPLIISLMQEKYKKYSGVDFYIMDVRELRQFQDKTFSLIIDKGCLDCIFCGLDLYESSIRYCSEIYRVLQDEGTCFIASHAPPPARVPYLRSVRWAIDTAVAPSGEGISLYILLKTNNQEIIDRKIAGAEASIRTSETGIVSSLDQNMNKMSNIRNSKQMGSLTVTANIDTLAEMVNAMATDPLPQRKK